MTVTFQTVLTNSLPLLFVLLLLIQTLTVVVAEVESSDSNPSNSYSPTSSRLNFHVNKYQLSPGVTENIEMECSHSANPGDRPVYDKIMIIKYPHDDFNPVLYAQMSDGQFSILDPQASNATISGHINPNGFSLKVSWLVATENTIGDYLCKAIMYPHSNDSDNIQEIEANYVKIKKKEEKDKDIDELKSLVESLTDEFKSMKKHMESEIKMLKTSLKETRDELEIIKKEHKQDKDILMVDILDLRRHMNSTFVSKEDNLSGNISATKNFITEIIHSERNITDSKLKELFDNILMIQNVSREYDNGNSSHSKQIIIPPLANDLHNSLLMRLNASAMVLINERIFEFDQSLINITQSTINDFTKMINRLDYNNTKSRTCRPTPNPFTISTTTVPSMSSNSNDKVPMTSLAPTSKTPRSRPTTAVSSARPNNENILWPDGHYSFIEPASSRCLGLGEQGYLIASPLSIWPSKVSENPNLNVKNFVNISIIQSNSLKSSPIHFCTTHDQVDIMSYQTSGPWPKGNYCIGQHDSGSCPAGFLSGAQLNYPEMEHFYRFHLNDLDKSFSGRLRLTFCCRRDGSPNLPISMPSTSTFYLYRYGKFCQAVKDMDVSDAVLYISANSNNVSIDLYTNGDVEVEKQSGSTYLTHLCQYEPRSSSVKGTVPFKSNSGGTSSVTTSTTTKPTSTTATSSTTAPNKTSTAAGTQQTASSSSPS